MGCRIILLVTAAILGLSGWFAQNQRSEFRNETELSFEVPKTHLQIENPNGFDASLFRIVGNKRIELQRLDSNQSTYSFVLPPGNYLVSSPVVDYPVPVLPGAFPDASLVVRLDSPPLGEPALKSGNDWQWIPAGPAVIGDTLGIGAEDERPVRVFDIPGFWMSPFEVTNRQFAGFLSAQKNIDESWIDFTGKKCRIQKLHDPSGKTSFESDAPDLPVVMVSYHGAQAYCEWLTRETGSTHRLPTEPEWEKAARGPESFVYAYGNVYKQSSANQESGVLKPVGSYPANSYGLFDMTGNVFEWMSNQYDPDQPAKVMNQSLRGGSFVLDGMYLRNSFRMRQNPNVMTDDIGFRVLRESIQ